MRIPWYKQKTTWAAVGAIVTVVGGYFTDEVSLQAMVETIFLALTGVFMRQGIEKTKE